MYVSIGRLVTCLKIFLNESFLRRLVSACPAIAKHHDRKNKDIAAHTPRAAINPAQKQAFFSAAARLVNIYTTSAYYNIVRSHSIPLKHG